MIHEKYLSENYTKKTAVSNSNKISKELYNIVKNSNLARNEMGVLSTDLKPDMFKIRVIKGVANLDKPVSDKYRRTGKRMGRKSTGKLYDYIVIQHYDSFWKDYSTKYFSTAKSFNEFLTKMRKYV